MLEGERHDAGRKRQLPGVERAHHGPYRQRRAVQVASLGTRKEAVARIRSGTGTLVPDLGGDRQDGVCGSLLSCISRQHQGRVVSAAQVRRLTQLALEDAMHAARWSSALRMPGLIGLLWFTLA